MGSSSLSQRATRQRRPRRLVGTAAAAALLLALAAVGAAAAEESPTALDICLEGKGDGEFDRWGALPRLRASRPRLSPAAEPR
jgi:hypothetical protein